jgi:hypothetical protein
MRSDKKPTDGKVFLLLMLYLLALYLAFFGVNALLGGGTHVFML